jgi:hypothetical protein
MTRLLGVLLTVGLLYGVLLASDENARSWGNQQTIAGRLGFYGVITLGVGVLILAGCCWSAASPRRWRPGWCWRWGRSSAWSTACSSRACACSRFW